jgi:transcriptional regulator with XRE-family HTH domain
VTLLVWPRVPASSNVAAVPKVRAEDRIFAQRLGGVLRELRRVSGWTQEQAAEKLGLVPGTLGRWERGDFAPKGYDLGRLYRGYRRFGAQPDWFFDPPEIVLVNPIRAVLDELQESGAIAADEREERAAGQRQRGVARRAGGRGTPPTGTGPRSARGSQGR